MSQSDYERGFADCREMAAKLECVECRRGVPLINDWQHREGSGFVVTCRAYRFRALTPTPTEKAPAPRDPSVCPKCGERLPWCCPDAQYVGEYIPHADCEKAPTCATCGGKRMVPHCSDPKCPYMDSCPDCHGGSGRAP